MKDSKNLERMLKHHRDRIQFKIKSALSPGYSIERSGDYARVPDKDGETLTRIVHECKDVVVAITEMAGPRKAREEMFDMDMEVELVRGDLLYKFPDLGTAERLHLMRKILIPAGVLFTYEFESEKMACIFTMYKNGLEK